jgi:hypothetical protein
MGSIMGSQKIMGSDYGSNISGFHRPVWISDTCLKRHLRPVPAISQLMRFDFLEGAPITVANSNLETLSSTLFIFKIFSMAFSPKNLD